MPNITQDETGIGYWSRTRFGDYLSTGLTPVNTQAGESMAAVIANLAHLSPDDRAGMAEYIKSLPAIDSPNAGAPALNRTPTIRMLPADSSGAKSPTSVLSAPADALAQANILYTVAIKPFFLDRAGASPTGFADRKLLPATKLAVLARAGNLPQFRVHSWQQERSP